MARAGVRLAPRPVRLAAQRRRFTQKRIAPRGWRSWGLAGVGTYLRDRVSQRGWLLADVAAELAAHLVTVRRLLDQRGVRRTRLTATERAAADEGRRVQSVVWQARGAMRAELRVGYAWPVGELARLGVRP